MQKLGESGEGAATAPPRRCTSAPVGIGHVGHRIEHGAPLPQGAVAGHDRDGLRQALGLDRLEDPFERVATHHHVDPLVSGEQFLGQQVERRGAVAFGDQQAVGQAFG